MAVFPGAVATNADLFIAVNNLSCLLTDNPLTVGATTVNVNSTTGFPTVGTISIDAEIIHYTGITATSFTGCTRGFDGTTAASHTVGSQVDHNVVAVHHNSLKDEIIAIESFIDTHIGKSTVVTAAEFERLSGVTSPIQTQLNGKASTALSNLTSVAINTTLASDTDNTDDLGTTLIGWKDLFLTGAIKSGGTTLATTTELGYLTGVTSAIQTQLNAKATDSLVVHLAGTETITGQKTFSLSILAPNGTVTVPAYSFSGDTNTGIYEVAADDLGVTIGGTLRLNINSSGLHGSAYYATQDGTITGPIYSWDADTNTGLYRIGADDLGVTAGGGNVASFSSTGVDIKGTTTNDSAAAGFVGETVSSVQDTNTNFPATGTYGDLTSMSLTAGDWDISSAVWGIQSGATWTEVRSGIGQTSGNNSPDLGLGASPEYRNGWASSSTTPTHFWNHHTTSRVSLSATTTIYLKYRAAFSAGTPVAQGRMMARRVR